MESIIGINRNFFGYLKLESESQTVVQEVLKSELIFETRKYIEIGIGNCYKYYKYVQDTMFEGKI